MTEPAAPAPATSRLAPVAEDAPPLLEVEDLRVWYPVHGGLFLRHVGDVKAVDGVSFALRQGETVGLVGESGCGKTTVGKAVMRLIPITSGKVRLRRRDGSVTDLAGLSRSQMRPVRSEVQMVYQDPYSSLAWILEKVGLTAEQAYRYPHEFSGGQRQRIGIARSLVTSPRLLIADEPVSALDVSIQAQVLNLLQDLQEEFGLTYLFIAHDLSVVEHISHRIAVMYLGNIVELAGAQEVYRQPLHPYSRALLSSVPLPDPELHRPDRVRLTGEIPSPMRKPSGCPFRTRCPLAQPSCASYEPRLVEVAPGRLLACPVVAGSK